MSIQTIMSIHWGVEFCEIIDSKFEIFPISEQNSAVLGQIDLFLRI
jgi:hypothetical protein